MRAWPLSTQTRRRNPCPRNSTPRNPCPRNPRPSRDASPEHCCSCSDRRSSAIRTSRRRPPGQSHRHAGAATGQWPATPTSRPLSAGGSAAQSESGSDAAGQTRPLSEFGKGTGEVGEFPRRYGVADRPGGPVACGGAGCFGCGPRRGPPRRLHCKARRPVDQVSDLDLAYTPPLGSPWDAVQAATQAWSASPEFRR
jgi:hypothetical protein